jgi:hypothetical protein
MFVDKLPCDFSLPNRLACRDQPCLVEWIWSAPMGERDCYPLVSCGQEFDRRIFSNRTPALCGQARIDIRCYRWAMDASSGLTRSGLLITPCMHGARRRAAAHSV